MKAFDAKKLIEALSNIEECYEDECWTPAEFRYYLLETQKIIDAEPVAHAHWIHKRGYDGDRHTVCSNCGGDRCGHFNFKFCPDCGAKMDEGDDRK